MKLSIKIFFATVVILAFLFSVAHIILLFKAKSLITANLENLTQKKVNIGVLDVKFPLDLEIRNLDIKGLARIEYIYVSPSILGLLTGNIALNRVNIIRPELYLERNAPRPLSEEEALAVVAGQPAKIPKKRHLRLIFKHFSLKEGKINFLDTTAGPDGIKITIKDLNFNIDNLYLLPRSVISNFQLKGKIPWQKDSEDGIIDVEGWINLFKKDMRATVNVKNIDGVYLHPYYANWVDLEKSRIQQAKLNFNSEITGHNNDIIADCHLELTDIVFRPKEEEEPQEKAHKIATAVLDLFKAFNGKIDLNFTIRTKMDRPEFGFDNIRMAVEDKIAKTSKQDKLDTILSIPVKLIETTVRGATDITKAMIGGTAAIGKEIKKGAEEIFKKEENSTKPTEEGKK